MAPSIYLIVFPVLSFAILLLFGTKMSKTITSIIGVFGIALSSLYALLLFNQSLSHQPERQWLWSILPDQSLAFSAIDVALLVDPLSVTMSLVVANVSFWIALYATEYMAREEGLVRFFATINLFVAFMLLLVLADNLLVLFIGWEGVGICSYLLIGFYYREKSAELAAMKAFLTTRVGDVFLLFAMFLCVAAFNTTDIASINSQSHAIYPDGSLMITLIALCLLGAAVGKSAQIPLQIWLPDAMWGPTPVSALIHAATMVTAGVYLLARMSAVFVLSHDAQMIVLAVGCATLIIGSLSALVQTDLKRVLAYSTMSQIGYMFLALGVQAPQAAMFHLVTHAFFKALLFLCAGVIGHTLHTYDMANMGGLYKKMPLTANLLVIGCLSLVGMPFISAGFFSKEWILDLALAHPQVGLLAYSIGVFGVFLTALYTGRMVLLVCFGELKTKLHGHHGPAMTIPLIVLAIFSTGIGWLQIPPTLAHMDLVSSYLMPALPNLNQSHQASIITLMLPSFVSLVGITIAFLLWRGYKLHEKPPSPSWFISLLRDGGGLNRLCMRALVKPYVALAHAMSNDVVACSMASIRRVLENIFTPVLRIHKKSLAHHLSLLIFFALALASSMVWL